MASSNLTAALANLKEISEEVDLNSFFDELFFAWLKLHADAGAPTNFYIKVVASESLKQLISALED